MLALDLLTAPSLTVSQGGRDPFPSISIHAPGSTCEPRPRGEGDDGWARPHPSTLRVARSWLQSARFPDRGLPAQAQRVDGSSVQPPSYPGSGLPSSPDLTVHPICLLLQATQGASRTLAARQYAVECHLGRSRSWRDRWRPGSYARFRGALSQGEMYRVGGRAQVGVPY